MTEKTNNQPPPQQQEGEVEDQHMHDTENAQTEEYDDQQYDPNYPQQYEEGEEQQPGDEESHLYEAHQEEYGEQQPGEEDPNSVVYGDPADAAAAVASAAAAAVASHDGNPEDQEYADHHQEEEYAEQPQEEQYADHHQEGEAVYMEDDGQQYDDGGEQQDPEGGDDQTLASHPATSREMEVAESMVVDNEHGGSNHHAMSTEVSQALDRYEYTAQNPDGLQTLAATSSAVTPHGAAHLETPTRSHSHIHSSLNSPMYDGKPMMPKFNRARNWSPDETKILLHELERIVTAHPDERRENILRSHATYEEIAEVFREKGYSNRDGQGCMIRWRNLLRVYKRNRAAVGEGNPPSQPANMQFAASIENIYHFPPDSNMSFMHGDDMPETPITGDATTPAGGVSRTWSVANGSGGIFDTPTGRKRTRDNSQMVEHMERVDQKLDQAMDYFSQQGEVLRSLEERLTQAEESLKQSEAVIDALNNTISEKDAKRDELEKQLMVTVQALSQVIATKKTDPQQLLDDQELGDGVEQQEGEGEVEGELGQEDDGMMEQEEEGQEEQVAEPQQQQQHHQQQQVDLKQG